MNANVKTPNVRSKKQDKAAKRAETRTKADAAPSAAPEKKQALAGTQTLARGLEVIDAVAQGATSLTDLAAAISLTRSTTHRLAATLVGLVVVLALLPFSGDSSAAGLRYLPFKLDSTHFHPKSLRMML